ncbi:hypothetical protein [Kinneretia aquatilis]|uniref:hypothetical protein n=1 Tax=Kinneretia aquatilis TaxID=2070761 RepID=UPI00149524B7|nr:hypothetical protein [Paucibacter aquatile]WIV96289.1 hypothetical protein K9V56_014710 [Paucibacter aquatile]
MPMWLTLEPGGRRQVHSAAELAQALEGWSAREAGSFVVLEAPSGRCLQAAGCTATGFQLEWLDDEAEDAEQRLLRTERDDLSRAELLRRLQDFWACGGEGRDAQAPWRRGRRWLPDGHARGGRREDEAPTWWSALRALLILMIFPGLLILVGCWELRENERFRSQAKALDMRVLAREEHGSGRKAYVQLRLRPRDAEGLEQGREQERVYTVARGRFPSWSQPGDVIQLWQLQDGSGRLLDSEPHSYLVFLMGVLFGLGVLHIWLRGIYRDWRRRGQRPRWSGLPPRRHAATGD